VAACRLEVGEATRFHPAMRPSRSAGGAVAARASSRASASWAAARGASRAGRSACAGQPGGRDIRRGRSTGGVCAVSSGSSGAKNGSGPVSDGVMPVQPK